MSITSNYKTQKQFITQSRIVLVLHVFSSRRHYWSFCHFKRVIPRHFKCRQNDKGTFDFTLEFVQLWNLLENQSVQNVFAEYIFTNAQTVFAKCLEEQWHYSWYSQVTSYLPESKDTIPNSVTGPCDLNCPTDSYMLSTRV